MKFVQTCVENSLPIWERCMESDFLRGIADGSLNEDCFKGYIVDDSLYLREYAKVFAWGMLHAANMEEIRAYYSLLAFVNESEDGTRKFYLQRYGLRDADVQRLPLRPENQAYVDEMLRAARDAEGPAECMMASLPCMLSYGWIFRRMIRQTPGALNTPYGRFVGDYAGAEYERLCGEWIAFADGACQQLTAARREHCLGIFRACSEHELRFWEMSARPRGDLK
jgi:thiaminase/transcriptional activator TenA